MRRALLIALLAGCGQTPDDLFVVWGQTLSPGGDPLDGVRMTLLRGRETDFTPLREALTADGGRFSFDLIRAEVEPLAGDEVWWNQLFAQFPSGVRAQTSLVGLPTRVEVPPLHDWRTGLSFDDAGVARFTPLIPGDGECGGAALIFHTLELSASHGTLWTQSDLVERVAPDGGLLQERVPLTVTDDLLEEATIGAVLTAQRLDCYAPISGPSAQAPFHVVTTWWGATRLLTSERVPASRGARCPEVSPAGACHLTDGVATFRGLPRPMSRFRLELDRPAAIRTVVLRAAVSPFELPPPARLTVTAGADTLTVPVTPQGVPREVIGIDADRAGRLQWIRAELPRALAPSGHVEVSLDTPLAQLAELSLFEE